MAQYRQRESCPVIRRPPARDFGGLVAWLAGRFDMVCFKLYAAVDQGGKSKTWGMRPAEGGWADGARKD
jgi:hypothetical protein